MSKHYFRKKRSNIKSTETRLRLSVFRSNRHIVAQIIDDSTGHTMAHASSISDKLSQNTEAASTVGRLIAERAKEKSIKSVVFDRGNRVYSGRIKALAQAARESGLAF